MAKYSDLRKKLKIEVTKPERFDLAHLTHYLQNCDNGVSHYFEEPAVEYLVKVSENQAKEPYFQGYLPIKWDIPFPPIKNPKFKFIDLSPVLEA